MVLVVMVYACQCMSAWMCPCLNHHFHDDCGLHFVLLQVLVVVHCAALLCSHLRLRWVSQAHPTAESRGVRGERDLLLTQKNIGLIGKQLVLVTILPVALHLVCIRVCRRSNHFAICWMKEWQRRETSRLTGEILRMILVKNRLAWRDTSAKIFCFFARMAIFCWNIVSFLLVFRLTLVLTF